MYSKFLKAILTVTFLFVIVGCGNDGENVSVQVEATQEPIEIINPWLRAMPEGIINTAGFMTVKNNTGKPLILEDVSIDWARMGMMHESKIIDGMAKMLHKDKIEITDQLEFKPGGLHIMVMGVDETLDPSKTYNILLHFAGREPLAVAFKVGQAK